MFKNDVSNSRIFTLLILHLKFNCNCLLARARLCGTIYEVCLCLCMFTRPWPEEITLLPLFPTAVCRSGCNNGGTCVGPNRCRCKSGWTGSSCSQGRFKFLRAH